MFRQYPLQKLAAASLLLASLTISTVQACRDPGINICASGDVPCVLMTTDRWLFVNGNEVGTKAPQYSHSDLTQGCYCQLSSVYRSSYGSSTEIATSTDDYLLVTSCTPDFRFWWDGQYAMTRMGGTLTMDLGRNPEYMAMYCEAESNKYGTPPTTLNHDVILIDWPTAAQAKLENTLPANVRYFADADNLCAGYDIQEDFYPNRGTPAPALSASQVTNCTCYVSSITAIGSSGGASSNNGNSFHTVCDSSNNVYFNGKGFRTTRKGVTASEHLLTDYCGYPRQSDYQLAYVVASNAVSPSSTSMRTSTIRPGVSVSTGSAATSTSTPFVPIRNSSSRSTGNYPQSCCKIFSLLAAFFSVAAFVL